MRELSPATRIEVLTPDFRGRLDRALDILKAAPPDVMNHNLETVPRLYKEARPGSDYAFSLNLLKRFKAAVPGVPTKSGLMVGLGETDDEILQVMRDMREHGIDMLTIGQYLAPSGHHLPVRRYVHPDTFRMFEARGRDDGLHPCRGGRAWCAPATTPTSRRMPPAWPTPSPERREAQPPSTARTSARWAGRWQSRRGRCARCAGRRCRAPRARVPVR